jgi:hypothetical protein
LLPGDLDGLEEVSLRPLPIWLWLLQRTPSPKPMQFG